MGHVGKASVHAADTIAMLDGLNSVRTRQPVQRASLMCVAQGARGCAGLPGS